VATAKTQGQIVEALRRRHTSVASGQVYKSGTYVALRTQSKAK